VRFVGLVLALIALAVGYYLGYRGLSFGQTRDRLAQLLGLPGLASSSPSADAGYNPLGAAALQQAAKLRSGAAA
jgi:hypothetical protein